MRKFLLIAVLLLISVVFCSAGEKHIVAASNTWLPFVDPEHPGEGLSLEIIRAAYQTQGYTVQLKNVPWARAEYGVREGRYDILPDAWMTDERIKHLVFSEPYAVNRILFIKTRDDPFEYTGLESLDGKIVGTIRGFGYSSEFVKATNFLKDPADDFITNIKKLLHQNKRIDLTLADEIVARVSMARENPALLARVRFTRNSLSSNPLYIACSRNNPRCREIIEAFNRGLEQIRAEGVFERISKGYGLK